MSIQMTHNNDDELLFAIRDLAQEVRILREILRPELSETETYKRMKEQRTANFLEALKFSERHHRASKG